MRDITLDALVNGMEQAIDEGHASMPSARPMAATVFRALRQHIGAGASETSSQPPVYRHLDAALARTRSASPAIAALAASVATLAPRLTWYRRPPADGDAPTFQDNHANTVIIGPDGIEQRGDVRIGMSLLAPHTLYPDHRHPPEEVYIVLSPGRWRQNADPWLPRQAGQLVHNPPAIWHAMASDEAPLLAIWMLWLGTSNSQSNN